MRPGVVRAEKKGPLGEMKRPARIADEQRCLASNNHQARRAGFLNRLIKHGKCILTGLKRHTCKFAMNVRTQRVELDRLEIGARRFLKSARCAQRRGYLKDRLSRARREQRCLALVRKRLLQPPKRAQRDAAIDICADHSLLDSKRDCEQIDRKFVPISCGLDRGQVVESIRMARIAFQRALECGPRPRHISLMLAGQTKRIEGVRRTRSRCRGPLIGDARLCKTAGVFQHIAEIDKHHILARMKRGSSLKRDRRIVGSAGASERHPLQMKRFNFVGGDCEGRFDLLKGARYVASLQSADRSLQNRQYGGASHNDAALADEVIVYMLGMDAREGKGHEDAGEGHGSGCSMTDMQEFQIDLPADLQLSGVKRSGGAGTPILCIPGLTRNAADFEDFAVAAASTGRDVYAISLRGRGRSDYDSNYLNYFPTTYVGDVLAALDQLGLSRAIFVGTSLGGIVTMLTAAAAPERIAGAVINDVGPELAPEGIARIASYVGARAEGANSAAADLDAAIAQIQAINEVAFPGKDRAFWETFARRTFEPLPDGSWKLAYDPNIGRALLETGPAPDLWAPFAATVAFPTLIVRGAISDLLTPPIIDKMRAARPGFEYCEVANVGHAPTLTEPGAWAAISDFIARVG